MGTNPKALGGRLRIGVTCALLVVLDPAPVTSRALVVSAGVTV